VDRSEAGKLGNLKSKVARDLAYEERIKNYQKSPNVCKYCSKIIIYEKRKNLFCSSRCSASYNNVRRQSKRLLCLNCNTEISNKKIFCNVSCHKEYQYKENIRLWKEGELKGWSGKTVILRPWLRKYIHELYGTACSLCGWNEKHPVDGKVMTEIDHIDGNAKNNNENNLRVLCPNCHSLTPTFRARNRNSVRDRKG